VGRLNEGRYMKESIERVDIVTVPRRGYRRMQKTLS
jgi:DNA-binding winged helix-turn-helix (wHTH) protein